MIKIISEGSPWMKKATLTTRVLIEKNKAIVTFMGVETDIKTDMEEKES